MSLLTAESTDNIFQPNNHSKSAMEFIDVEPAVSQKVSRLVHFHYGHIASEVLSVQRFKGTEISSHNYKVQLRSKYIDRLFYILMRAHKEFDSEFVRGVIRACGYLGDRGCRVPSVILNAKKNAITDFEGERFTAYKFIEGTHYQGNTSELLSVASNLAKLDRRLVEMKKDMNTDIFNKPDDKRDELEFFSREIWDDLVSRASSRVNNGIGDYFDDVVIASSKYIFEAIDLCQSVKNNSPVQLVHSDLHPHNLITDGHDLLAFIDLDSLRFWERMRAISFAVHRLVLQYLVKNNIPSSSRSEVIRLAKDAFICTYDKVNTLSVEESESVGHFIQHEALRRTTFVAKGFYIDGKEEWKMAIYKQIRSLLEAKYFMD